MSRTLTHEQVAALAESVGLPGEAFAQIAKGESGYQVDAVGHDPGGTQGLGLWQITTKYNDDIIARFGGREKLLTDPVANAKAAKAIYDRQGIKAWYGTKYLTDPTAHYHGAAQAPKEATPSTPSAPSASGAVDPAAGREEAKRAALQQYVLSQGTAEQPNSLTALGQGLKTAAQVPDARTALTQRKRSQPSTATPAGGSGDGFHGSKVLELIHNDGGKGYGIKDGQVVNGSQVFAGVWAGHANHVHVAAGRKTVVALGNLAESMGLVPSENPHFGGVTQGAHVADSYHYKDEAIDVHPKPGDPKGAQKMREYARRVEQYNKTDSL